jgi:V/A-type H+-transporting ATPase subunit F
MGRIVALVDEDTALGFRLAGIESRAVETPKEMEQNIASLSADREVRIVILDEGIFNGIPEPLKRKSEESVSPIFVPVPTLRQWRVKIRPEEYVARLIRRAIGYQIKIRR